MANQVPLKINGLNCVCVPLSKADFSDIAAIYIILCVNDDGSYKVIDIGQSGKLGERINTHDRKNCWKRKCPHGNIWVCVYKMPSKIYTKQDRLDLEKKWRAKHHNLCGKI